MSQFIAVNEENFDATVLESTLPVLVDFWAPWCSPCRALMPVIESLCPAYADKVLFVKINVDESPELARKYGVRGIPRLLLIKQGTVVNTHTGLLDKAGLVSFLDADGCL